MNVRWWQRKRTCLRCETPFTEQHSLGTLMCRFHPGELDLITQHYTCCGASPDKNDFAHYESLAPKGCVRVDHTDSGLCASRPDPYAIVWERDAVHLPLAVYSEPRCVVHRKRIQRFSAWTEDASFIVNLSPPNKKTLSLPVPLNPVACSGPYLCGSGRTSDEEEEEEKQDLYSAFECDVDGDVDDGVFYPILIVPRTDVKFDTSKINEIYTDAPCSQRVFIPQSASVL